MKVVVREAAARDLDDIFNWISKDSPGAAAGIVKRIQTRINRLAISGFAGMGRPGSVEGTRELIEPPYIVVYDVEEAANELLSSLSCMARGIGRVREKAKR